MSLADDRREWLEADGLGGFASGTVSGIRTRRYHALLLAAATPPTGRCVLVNGLELAVTTAAGTYALSAQRYAPEVIHPDGAQRLIGFTATPWPTWTYQLEDGTRVRQELFVPRGTPAVVLRWQRVAGRGAATLSGRPLFSGRDYHTLHHENAQFQFEPLRQEGRLLWQPYPGLPGVLGWANGTYTQAPQWYRQFLYVEERARGLDCVEDLASPGVWQWELAQGEAWLVLLAHTPAFAWSSTQPLPALVRAWRQQERRRRRAFPTVLHQAAETYIVQRGAGQTLVAGYPWFTDWGRDTFIALRGLCLSTGRLEEARAMLRQWAGAVSEGMLPNRFPDGGETPEYNSVDASLWYIIAVNAWYQAMRAANRPVTGEDQQHLRQAIDAILTGYADGTRFGIQADTDGLLRAGVAGTQLTWMDAKVGDWVVTPRIGKPVEVQTLWLNALWIGSAFSERWEGLFARGREAFRSKFWFPKGGYLYDVIDVAHEPGRVDAAFRPNQLLALGGLPVPLISGEAARRLVAQVEQRLWTPMGLRSLAPEEPDYAPHYEGGVRERDGAYHQGTVWPWLIGPFVEAWVRVRGDTPQARRAAARRFLAPLVAYAQQQGFGHLPEIADAEPPHAPRGCPFQAWSLGEVLRLQAGLNAAPRRRVTRRAAAPMLVRAS